MKVRKLLIFGIALILVACSVDENDNNTHKITDESTKPEIESVEVTENTALIDWNSDAMDRGNHDYNTMTHSELVVELGSSELKRGDVIYYKTPKEAIEKNSILPEHYIARIIGLPGETVEIKKGQVFINKKILDTFYAKATMRGMEEEEYFEKTDTANIEDIEATKEYFATTMKPVDVNEGSIFVLVDQWWRGTDSREFGVLLQENVQGRVLGYSKE